jgi:hypothetical protein
MGQEDDANVPEGHGRQIWVGRQDTTLEDAETRVEPKTLGWWPKSR